MAQKSFSQSTSPAMALATVRIVLVAPAGPLNVGSVARVMKNFGLSQLWLVAPQCDPLGAEAMQMAVHAKDVLQAAKLVETIPEALVGCARAIATTARQRGFNAPLYLPDVALPNLLLSEYDADADHQANLQAAPRTPTALIFGPEDRGLSNEELTYAQHFIKIPTHPDYSALNLAQAVAICCYELQRASQSVPTSEQIPLKALRSYPISGKQSEPSINSDPPNVGNLTDELPASQLNSQPNSQPNNHLNAAKLDDLEGYLQHLERVLLQVEYLYPHTAASRMRKFRQLLYRAAPTASEVALLRGILRQMEWALSDSNKGPL